MRQGLGLGKAYHCPLPSVLQFTFIMKINPTMHNNTRVIYILYIQSKVYVNYVNSRDKVRIHLEQIFKIIHYKVCTLTCIHRADIEMYI